METKIDTKSETKELSNKQTIILNDKKFLSVSGTNKVISLKSDLIQLDTNYGGLQIVGENLELIKLDNSTTTAEISGDINQLKFVEKKNKETFIRKIFK